MGKAKKKTRHVEVQEEPVTRRSVRISRPPPKLREIYDQRDEVGEVDQTAMAPTINIDEEWQALTSTNLQLTAELKLAQQRLSSLEKRLDEQLESTQQAVDFSQPSTSHQMTHGVQQVLNDAQSQAQQPTNGPVAGQIDVPPIQQQINTRQHNAKDLIDDDGNVQQMLTNAIAQMLNPDAKDNEGENIVSRLLILGATLDQKMKARIWSREYIDLTSLADHSSPSVSVSLLSDGKPSIALKPAKTLPPGSFNQWLQLFCTYAAVYLERYQDEASSILTYIIRIFEMSKKHGGYIWRAYDEGFRKVRAFAPVPWHKTNWDLVFNVQTAENRNLPFRKNFTPRFQNKGKQTKESKGICFSFNRSGKCTRQPCQFRHECTVCNKRGHWKGSCYLRRQGSQQGNNLRNNTGNNAGSNTGSNTVNKGNN